MSPVSARFEWFRRNRLARFVSPGRLEEDDLMQEIYMSMLEHPVHREDARRRRAVNRCRAVQRHHQRASRQQEREVALASVAMELTTEALDPALLHEARESLEVVRAQLAPIDRSICDRLIEEGGLSRGFVSAMCAAFQLSRGRVERAIGRIQGLASAQFEVPMPAGAV